MVAKLYEDSITLNDTALKFAKEMINNYGNVLFLADTEKATLEREKHHDYVFFCITKSVRSLFAANTICVNCINREDTLVIVRTAYEMYLSMANAIKSDLFTFKAVDVTLGLYFKDFEYSKFKNGRPNTKKVDIGNGKTIEYNMSKYKLAKNTFCEIDEEVHNTFYKYISEIVHGNFICSGNYRTEDGKHYTVDSPPHIVSVIFIMYVLFLIIQSIHLELLR